MKIFTPNEYAKSVHDIDYKRLKTEGKSLLIFDLDNTLAPNDVPKATPDVKKLFSNLKKSGFKIAIVSNNYKERVDEYCQGLDVFHIALARKPLKFSFKKVMKHFEYPNIDSIVMIGDQLITDICYANRNKIYSILVTAVDLNADANITKRNRRFEEAIYKRIETRNILTRGKYGKIK